MKNGLPELAGSSAPIAQSETMIARQRALIARLRALGKPTDAAERVLAQSETNLRLMHKVHQLIKVRNPVQGPPGFQIGNVFVLAGIPRVMQGMLEDVGPRLRTGRVVISRTVRVEGTGESVMAAPLEALANAHPNLSLGSYPFFSADGFGSNLVVRGRDADEVATAVDELVAAMAQIGARAVTRVEAEVNGG